MLGKRLFRKFSRKFYVTYALQWISLKILLLYIFLFIPLVTLVYFVQSLFESTLNVCNERHFFFFKFLLRLFVLLRPNLVVLCCQPNCLHFLSRYCHWQHTYIHKKYILKQHRWCENVEFPNFSIRYTIELKNKE